MDSDQDRGAAIQQRLHRLGISDREFYRETGIDRKTLNRAIANEPNVRPQTYNSIEAWLRKLEARAAGQPAEAADLVTFRLSGNFGVEVTVSGPVSDVDALEAAVERLIRKMGEDDPTPSA